MAKELLLGLLGVLVTGLAFGGWGASEYLNAKYAARDAVLVAEAKADFVLDRQMEAIINEIGHLERKKAHTPSELERMRYLRDQLKTMRDVRRGK